MYWPVVFFEALMITLDGSNLKQGLRPAILIVIMEERVPSRAKPFLVFVFVVFVVLLRPTTEKPA